MMTLELATAIRNWHFDWVSMIYGVCTPETIMLAAIMPWKGVDR